MNAYGFGTGDRVNFSDPYGLCIEDACVGEALALAAAANAVAPGSLHFVGAVVRVGITSAASYAAFNAAAWGEAVIGKLGQLHLKVGERELDLPNMGSYKGNWKQNAGRLREAIREGGAIRDAHVDAKTGALLDDRKANGSGSFLTMERNLLRDQGYTYDIKTTSWKPPKR